MGHCHPLSTTMFDYRILDGSPSGNWVPVMGHIPRYDDLICHQQTRYFSEAKWEAEASHRLNHTMIMGNWSNKTAGDEPRLHAGIFWWYIPLMPFDYKVFVWLCVCVFVWRWNGLCELFSSKPVIRTGDGWGPCVTAGCIHTTLLEAPTIWWQASF